MSVVDAIVRFASENPGNTVQILFSGVLAFATIAYTISARQQVHEMQTDREVRNRPIVKPTIENRYALHHFFAVENTGEGTAYDVTAEWWADEDDKHEWKIPLLSPGERRVFPLPFLDEDGNEASTRSQIEQASDGDATIQFRAWYYDSLGNSYSPGETPELTQESVSVLETIERREEESEYVDKEPIEVIADEMDEVTNQLKSIEKSIQMEHLDERAREEIHERILDEIREEESVTFRELKNGLGVERQLLAGILRNMMEVGQVDYDEEYTGFFFKDAMDAKIEYVGGRQSV